MSTTNTMALRALMRAKIAATNTISGLDSLDCFTDDWDTTSALASPALDIHLHCTYAAEECKAIAEILDSFLLHPASGRDMGVFVELQVRRENALEEMGKVVAIVEALEERRTEEAELSLREMGRRAQRLVGKVEGLKGMVEELERLVFAPV